MTNVRSDIDLSQLKRTERVSSSPPPRKWLRIVVPVLILIAFGGILASSIGDLFGKSVDVTVVRPKLSTDESGISTNVGAVALQAAGWIEPDPYPILVPALASGVVREVLVQESDEVKAGDPVARMIDDEAKIGLEKAEAAVAEAQADKVRADAEARLAKESFDAALSVTENAAVMKAAAEGKVSESRHLAAAVAGGESDLQLAREELIVQQELAKNGAAGPRAVEIAQAKVRSAEAAVEALKASAALAADQVKETAARAHRAARDVDLRLEDRLRLETAQAALGLASAKVKSAEALQKEATLRYERMTIRAPAAGVVIDRRASPGSTLVVDDPERSSVCSLFDPAHLRVRVDVSQSDVAKVIVGQDAEILSQSRSQKAYKGKVIRLVQRADIQKVTLQVHVRVLDGDALLRPEMLCQVKLLAVRGAETAPSSSAASASPAVLIPARLLVEDRFVWVMDAESAKATRKSIEVDGRSGDWVLVRSGLNVSDKLIDGGREQLSEGVRVKLREQN